MKKYNISFHCAYSNGNTTKHRQEMTLTGIKKWVEAYSFTHPQCESISVKVWLHDEDGGADNANEK